MINFKTYFFNIFQHPYLDKNLRVFLHKITVSVRFFIKLKLLIIFVNLKNISEIDSHDSILNISYNFVSHSWKLYPKANHLGCR